MKSIVNARWNGVTGHAIPAPDLGGTKDETQQRVQHLALAAIVDLDADNEEKNGTVGE